MRALRAAGKTIGYPVVDLAVGACQLRPQLGELLRGVTSSIRRPWRAWVWEANPTRILLVVLEDMERGLGRPGGLSP